LIQSGGAQDTGLLVGDYATRTTVEVVPPNTIQGGEPPPPPPPRKNVNQAPPPPGTINSSTLPTAFIVSSPFSAGSFTFPFGFSAPNITIGTPTIDLSPYSNVSEFAFVAPNGTLTINGSVAFNGLKSTAILDLFANQFSFAAGSTVDADVGIFRLLPQLATTLSGVALVDNAPASSAPPGTITFVPSSPPSTLSFPLGGIEVDSPAAFSLTNGSSITAQNLPVGLLANSITINNSSLQGSFVGLNGATGVNIANHSNLTATAGDLGLLTAGGDIDIAASTLKATQGAASTGEIFFDAVGGAVNLTNGTNISAADAMSIFSGKGISLSASSVQGGPFVGLFGGTGVSTASNSTITATGGDLDIIASSGDIDLSATTIKAIQGAAGTGQTLVTATGGAVNLTSGTTISSADVTTIDGGNGVSISGSSVQGTSVELTGTTGVNLTNGSSLDATFGNLDIATTAGGINLSASTLNAIAGPTIGDSASGDVTIGSIGGAINISNGASITAANQVDLTSDTGISISGASNLTSSGGMFIDGDPSGASTPVSITGNSTLTSGTGSNLVIQAGTALTVNGATFNADPVSGSVYMSSDTGSISVQSASLNSDYIDLRTFSTAGSVTVKNTAITTNNLTLNSGDGILLDCNGLPPTGTGSLPQVNLTDMGISGSSLTVNHTDFSSFATVNMTAHTINLSNVNFGGTSAVNFYSNIPMLNVGSSVAGEVNFISNVTYGGPGHPAQNYVPIAQGGNWSSVGAPINITAGPY
jgi:hypothetical protein